MDDTEERQYIDYECHDHIAAITLNRPEKLNAVSDEVVRQLMAAFRRFDSDQDAYVAILCGRGRAFCSGADVHQRQLRSREEFERLGGRKDTARIRAICCSGQSTGSLWSPPFMATCWVWVLGWCSIAI
jgi:enoyl-CoA hydratase/carnithine racemase